MARALSRDSTPIRLYAPAASWSRWYPIWSQLGVVGRNAQDHETIVKIVTKPIASAEQTFDIQIKGGDRLIHDIGPGTTHVKISGNVATTLSIRLRSHLLGTQVRVTVY